MITFFKAAAKQKCNTTVLHLKYYQIYEKKILTTDVMQARQLEVEIVVEFVIFIYLFIKHYYLFYYHLKIHVHQLHVEDVG